MSTHKHIDRICCLALALALVLTVVFVNAERLGVKKASAVMGYESALFDTARVHTIDIVMDDWDTFTANCKSEEYAACSLVIDGEAYKNVAIRGKGNTSLSQVTNDRYSYKIEFDHYDSATTYHGLDKLCLNNIIQDNTYMKDYLSYELMRAAGAAAPLCSYVYLTVNGEDWGLYLAVEGVEESFLRRNFGSDCGALYKPDSTDLGGGRGNGQNFQEDAGPSGGSMSRDDVLLKYIDDDPASYPNIFDNAKTDCSAADKARLIAALQALSGENAADAVDTEAVIRYFVAHNFVLNFDSYTGSMIHNYYLYEQDGKLQMLPWDYNLAFGGFQSGGDATALVNYPMDTPVSGGSVADRPMLAWIFASQEYTALYHQYFSDLISEYFESGYFADEMDSVKSMIAPYVEKDPTKFCTYEEFETGIDTLKAFCLLRAESIRGQLDGTIGSTADTQTADTLINAESLTVSAMGSMGGGGQSGEMATPPEQNSEAPTDMPSDMPGDMPNQMPDGTPPDRPDGNSGSEERAQPPDTAPGSTSPDSTRPDRSDENSATRPDRSDKNSDALPGGTGKDSGGFGGQKPDFSDGESGPSAREQAPTSSLPLIVGSVAVLAAGLAFALLYKRRK